MEGANIWFPPLLSKYSSLLCFSHTVFIDLVTVDLRTFGKGAIGIEVIPFVANLQPFSGYHDAILGEVIGFVVAVGADVPKAHQHGITGVIPPVVGILDPADFQRAIGVEEVFHAVDDLHPGENFAVLVVEILSGVIQCPALRRVRVNGQLDIAMEHGADFRAGGAGFRIKLLKKSICKEKTSNHKQ